MFPVMNRTGDARVHIGMCFDRTFPAPFVVEVAEQLEADGVDQLWIIEDCFYTAGITLAAAALARTERLTVGLGILPAVARNPAITAMEIATLANLAPGRLIAGIGHGVQSWMAQMGARPESPLDDPRGGHHGREAAARAVRRSASTDARCSSTR